MIKELVLLDGVVRAKFYFDAYDPNYVVITKKVRCGFLKWKLKKVIIHNRYFKSEEYNIDTFNHVNKYYDHNEEIVMYKPHCDLYLSNGNTISKFFDTKQDLWEFIEFIKSNSKTIEIIH